MTNIQKNKNLIYLLTHLNNNFYPALTGYDRDTIVNNALTYWAGDMSLQDLYDELGSHKGLPCIDHIFQGIVLTDKEEDEETMNVNTGVSL